MNEVIKAARGVSDATGFIFFHLTSLVVEEKMFFVNDNHYHL